MLPYEQNVKSGTLFLSEVCAVSKVTSVRTKCCLSALTQAHNRFASLIIMLLFKDSLEIRRSSMLSRYFCYGRSFCTLLYQKQLVIVVKLGPDF